MDVCYVILIITIIVLAFVIWYNGKKWKNMYKFNGGGGGYFSDATVKDINGTGYYCYEYTCFIYSISQSNGNTIKVLKVGGGGGDNGYLLYNEPNIHCTYRYGSKTKNPNGIVTNDYTGTVYNGVYNERATSSLGLLRPDLAYTPFQRNYNGANVNLNITNQIQYNHNTLNSTIIKNDNTDKCFIKTVNTAIKFVAFHIYTTDANTNRGLCIEVNELEDKIVDFIKKNFDNVTCHSDANIAKWATTTNKNITQSDDGENFVFWNVDNIALTTIFNRIVGEIENGMLDILCVDAPTITEELSTMEKSIFIKQRALEQIKPQIEKLETEIAKPGHTKEELEDLTQKLTVAQFEELRRKAELNKAQEEEQKQARKREQMEARKRAQEEEMEALNQERSRARAERANRRRPQEQPKKQDRKRDRSNSRDRKRDRDMYDY